MSGKGATLVGPQRRRDLHSNDFIFIHPDGAFLLGAPQSVSISKPPLASPSNFHPGLSPKPSPRPPSINCIPSFPESRCCPAYPVLVVPMESIRKFHLTRRPPTFRRRRQFPLPKTPEEPNERLGVQKRTFLRSIWNRIFHRYQSRSRKPPRTPCNAAQSTPEPQSPLSTPKSLHGQRL